MITQEDITAARQKLDACPVCEPHILDRWEQVDWRVHEQDNGNDAHARMDCTMKIDLYPVLDTYSPDGRSYVMIREFGRMILSKASQDLNMSWLKKLALPTNEQIDAVQMRFNEGHAGYKQMVDSFMTPVDRLVALNIANALIANRTRFADATNLDIRTWGPTSDYCNFKRYHSLNPLVSAYCPEEVTMDFGAALAECAVNDMKAVTHTSVAAALRTVLSSILNRMR